MRRTSHLFPTPVFFVDYDQCNTKEALLNELRLAPHNTLTLPQINRIRVNGNSLVGSYGKAIQNLRKEGFHIATNVYRDRYQHITKSEYTLLNPLFNSDGTNF